MASQASSKSLLRDALSATTVKDKGPPVVDGILSITPDTPEVVEWRRSALDITETCSTYLEDDEEVEPRPNELFGKFTWKIENFSEISKRELRSNVFDVGGYKWYILVYPQGCDVCNHLSLFLCVADYDKLLPGWSHFAQFTIAVVNKDPKKSKYSDTLHRFCKKEHDWGWKKFMELSKVLDGFTVADTLVIKAQVQVILDKPMKPFRCLDPQYRRELVRVYLTNVEGVCRRFCDDKRARLLWVKDEADKFKGFWLSLNYDQQRSLLVDKAEAILKGLVKQFFNEKEVTSTLVMDALFSGCKQIEEHSKLYLEGKSSEGPPLILIRSERNTFTLLGDLLDLADRVTKDFIPMAKDDKMMQPNDGLALRSGQEDDYRRDSIERDEKRLAELGRKTVEMLVISHIITEKMEAAYREAEALKRQDQLIAEEFEMQKQEECRAKAQAEKEKEKKAKKKEKVKAKKEAERVKKEAEDVERRKLDERKRLEQERKAQEAAAADKKRQEEEQQKARQQAIARQAQQRIVAAAAAAAVSKQQQSHAPQASKGRQSAPAVSQQGPPESGLGHVKTPCLAQQQQIPSPQTSSSPKQSPTAANAQQQQQLASRPFASGEGAVSRSGASGSSSSGRSSSAGGGHADAELSDTSSSADVCTIDQAVGHLVEASDLDSSDNSREELEFEVVQLRSRVKQLEIQLAGRDADIISLTAQLKELQSSELTETVHSGVTKQHTEDFGVSGSVSSTGSTGGRLASSEKDTLIDARSETGVSANGPVKDVSNYTGSSLSSVPNRRQAAIGQYDPNATAHARVHMNGPQMHSSTSHVMQQQQSQQQRMSGGPAGVLSQQKSGEFVPAAVQPGLSYNHAGIAVQGQVRTAGSAEGISKAGMVPVAQVVVGPAGPMTHSSGAGLLHGANSHAMPVDSTPSYRNAAAGVVPGTTAPSSSRSVAVASLPNATPVKQKVAQQDEPSTPGATAPGSVVTPSPHGNRHLNHAAAEFTGASHLIMQQHQQSSGQSQPALSFGPVPSKRPQLALPQMDSPGLDDFAHMGLIDDLLTE